MTTPYYQDDLVTLYHGDCREVTEWLAADVLVTDPPYGMTYISHSSKHNGPTAPIVGDGDLKSRDWMLDAWGNRPALVFGTWRVQRPTTDQSVTRVGQRRQPRNGRPQDSLGSVPRRGLRPRLRLRRKTPGGVYRVNTLTANDSDRPDHPTPKPVPLMERLISHTVGVIADPFAGSGSTLVAAKMLGRKAIGVELEERYAEIAARRLLQDGLPFEDVS